MSASGLSVLGGAILVGVLAGVWLYSAPGPRARQGADTTVILRHGARLPEIASDLEQAGVVGSAPIFAALTEVTGAGRRLQAGEYDFPTRASIADILDKLKNGRIVHHYVTLPEGITSDEVVEVLMGDPVLTGPVPTPPEGAVLPETYSVERGEDRSAVLQRMMTARDKLLTKLWAGRSPNLPYQSPEDAVILASIVEKETALADERPRIAGLFVNRLRKGMRLESDPTIIYGLTRGRPLGHGIRVSEMQSQTPYNTYIIPGLPPTPIANPGAAALAAALQPANTQELYFVADGAGGHVFASTFEEHQKNVARWRQIEAQTSQSQAAQSQTAQAQTQAPPAHQQKAH
ncbi:MAG TPA: endolytic transglycosylase MltG [Caulobacteraceae bacterium]|nr:endolytic transglycosylase MltG [Caulobacteraceae bacterium]